MFAKRVYLNVALGLLSIFLTVLPAIEAEAHNTCASETIEDKWRYEGLVAPVQAPKFSGPARLGLTRFGAHADFNSSSTHMWEFDGSAFVREGVRNFSRINFDDTIVGQQQEFSLGKMVETGYLSPEEARMFHKLGVGLDTRQVDFFEIVHTGTNAEVDLFYKTYSASRRAGYHLDSDYREGMQTIKTAAMWNLAGQVWDRENGLRNVPLAWAKEEARKGQELDRNKYKIVFEWGRAAQDVPGEAIMLYSAISLLNYTQVRAYGGKLEDAYVMFHSFDEKNTRLYLRMFPDSLYPANWTNRNDALFLVPLKVALEKYKPSKASASVAKIVELSNGKISDLQAVDLLLEDRTFGWRELDFHTARVTQSTPIILGDPTYNHPRLLSLRFKKFGLTLQEGQNVLDYIGSIYSTAHTHNFQGKYNNAANYLVSSMLLRKANALEISNLDPNIAMFDPTYVPSVLMSAYNTYLDRAASMFQEAHGFSAFEAFHRAVQHFSETELKFAVTTSFAPVEKQLRALKPIQVVPLKGFKREHEEMDAEKPYLFRDANIYFFSFDQVRALIANNPDFFRELGGGLQPGVWQSHYFLSQPDLF